MAAYTSHPPTINRLRMNRSDVQRRTQQRNHRHAERSLPGVNSNSTAGQRLSLLSKSAKGDQAERHHVTEQTTI
jgi:hypothetical protein